MALTTQEITQLKTAGYTDSEINVMTEREARKKIEALGGTTSTATTGANSGGGFWANSSGLFGAIGSLSTAAFGFGSNYVNSQAGLPTGNTATPADNRSSYIPEVLRPENNNNLIWWIVGGVVVVGGIIGLVLAFRK